MKPKYLLNLFEISRFIVFAWVLCIGGCGKKGPPKPPAPIVPAEWKKETDLERLELKGRVKSREQTEFKFEIKNGFAIKTKGIVKKVEHYNEMGFRTEKISYDKNGTMTHKYKYTLDEKGNILERARHDSNGSVTSLTRYKREKKGDFVEVVTGKKYVQTYTYDIQGNLAEHEFASIDGKPLWKTAYKYGPSGLLIKKTSFTYSHNLEQNIAYTYDGKGNLVEKDDSNNGKTSYKYDQQGKRIEMRGPGDGRGKTIYKYDDQGNMVEEINIGYHGEEVDDKHKHKYDERGNIVSNTYYYIKKYDGNPFKGGKRIPPAERMFDPRSETMWKFTYWD